ncbi:hypothetical protein D3C78_1013850 [compost metagenome]
MLAGSSCSNCNILMRIAWRVNVNQINILALNELLPIRLCAFPAELCSSLLDSLRITAANGLHLRLDRIREKHRQRAISIAVRFPHKFIAHHTYSYFIHPESPLFHVLRCFPVNEAHRQQCNAICRCRLHLICIEKPGCSQPSHLIKRNSNR